MSEPTRPKNAVLPEGGDLMKLFEGPKEDTLDPGKRAILASAREAFRELEKLLKNIRLYGEQHQSVGRFRDRLFDGITKLLTATGMIELRVNPYELTVYDQVVYENPSPEHNFIYKFYTDGIRSLTFQSGMTEEELNSLVDVMLTDWEDPNLFEDDAVTLLWDKELKHIGHMVVDSFQEDTKRGEEHLYTIAGVVEQVRSKAKLEPKGDDSRKRRGKGVDPRSALSQGDLERFQEHPFAMDEAEFHTLKAVLTTTERETLEKFIEILFRVNILESEDDRKGRVVGLFDRIADLLLAGGRVGELERLLRKIRHLSGPEDGATLPENVAAIQRIFKAWTSEDFVGRITRALDEPEPKEVPSVLALAGLLDPEAAVPLIRRMGTLKAPEHRQLFYTLLPSLVAGQERSVARLLKEVGAELAHELFRVLRATGDGRHLMTATMAALGNADEAVRYEGLSFLPPAEISNQIGLLQNALKDTSKKVRSKALHLLARVQTPEVHQNVLERIQSKDFGAFDLDEKRRYFAVASLTGDANAWFLEQLGSSGGLLARKGQDELRHCAAVGLAIRLCKEARPLFEKEAAKRGRGDLVGEACTWALKHQECDREERTRQLYDLFFLGTLSTAEARRG